MRADIFSSATLAAVFAFAAAPGSALADDKAGSGFFEGAKVYADARSRYEMVDQDGLPEDAEASTLRVRAGFLSGEAGGFSLRVEGEGVLSIGREHYNDTVNGKTAYPVVADPEAAVLNQAVVRWRHGKTIDATAGRQAVNYDNQRWIGSVGWRQNDQTLDAAIATVSPAKGLTATYGYAWRVNRVFGPDSPQGIWRDNNIHMVRASYDAKAVGVITAYAYLLDLPEALTSSSKTMGLRLSGAQKLGKAKLLYTAEYAHQRDYAHNPRDFGLDYIFVEPGIAIGPLTAKLGYEELQGNGVSALQTPLATLHAFNGWADKFLTTPANGLQDLYVDVTLKPTTGGLLKGTTMRVAYHDFDATRGGADYGSEWNALVSRPVGKHLTLTAKLAVYESQKFATDTTKVWLMAETRF